MPDSDNIVLAHGGGGSLSRALTEEIFLPVFGNPYLRQLNDSAVLELESGRVAFTTDSFVVDPIFFPGGDIGRLAVCGTVNDLAVMGARPLYLSSGFILEEGLPLKDLKAIVESAAAAALEAGVSIVTGDTKVLPRGGCDRIFINTAGIGIFTSETPAAVGRARAGDAVVINGPIGRHGMAIMTSREDLGFRSRIESDVSPLNSLVDAMREVCGEIHVMRDATRGGLATVLNEMAGQAGVGIIVEEERIPVTEDVKGACEILGFDPLYVANEGILVACLPGKDADKVAAAMRNNPRGRESAVIGRVLDDKAGRVVLETRLGSHRVLDMLSGEQLPRIC